MGLTYNGIQARAEFTKLKNEEKDELRQWSKTEFGKAAFVQQKQAFLDKKKAKKKKRKRQSEGGESNSKSKWMSCAEVQAMLAEERTFNENASKAIFEGLNDFANCSNMNAAQKKVTIASTGTSILNKIVKLRPGAKGNDSP